MIILYFRDEQFKVNTDPIFRTLKSSGLEHKNKKKVLNKVLDITYI